MSRLESTTRLNAYTTGIRFFFPRIRPYESIKRGRSEEESRVRIDEYGFRTRLVGIGDELRDDCPVSTWLFTVALTSIPPAPPPPSPLNDPTKERRSLEPFASFFFSRGTQQWWTEDGPDGRHGRCAAQTARTPGEDPVTSRHPATVDDLARGGTPAWRIAPAACATVSHEIPFPSTCHDSLRRPIGSYPREKDTFLLAYRKVELIRKWRSSFLGRIDDNRWLQGRGSFSVD